MADVSLPAPDEDDREPEFPTVKDESLIPPGPYCYSPRGVDGDSYLISLCPYWDKREDKPEQQSGYCHFLERGDWEGGFGGLLWDQVKSCGANLEDPEDEDDGYDDLEDENDEREGG